VNPRSPTFRRMVLTASLVSLAMAMPLVVAVPLSVASEFRGSIDSRVEALADGQKRTDTLVKMVSDAARQFVAPQAHVFSPQPDRVEELEAASGLVLEVATPAKPSTLLASPQLIDLPPPMR
jgi:hypothetical protein